MSTYQKISSREQGRKGEMISLLSRKNGKTLEAIHVCSRVKSVGFQIISVASTKDKIVLHGTMRTILIKTHLSESIENWSGGRPYLPNDHYNFNFGCIIHTNEKS